METFNNQEEKDIYHLKKEMLGMVLLRHYPVSLSNHLKAHPDPLPHSSSYEQRRSEARGSTFTQETDSHIEEPSIEVRDQFNRKIQKLQSALPYVDPRSGVPYLPPERLTTKAFCQTICQLAKKIAEIPEPNTIPQLKTLRINILNTLDPLLQYFRDEIVTYGALPDPKPNYNRYHLPILKYWNKMHPQFRKIVQTFDWPETRVLYDYVSDQLNRMEVTFSLIEANISKWSCYSCCR